MSYFMSLNPLSLFRAMPGSIAQGMIWGVMALGVYITFRLLDFADLTVVGRHGNGTVEHRTGNPRNSGKYSDADLLVFH